MNVDRLRPADLTSDRPLQIENITSDRVDLLTCGRIVGVTVVHQTHIHISEATVMPHPILLQGL